MSGGKNCTGASFGSADRLSLTAAPTFALMALLTLLAGGDQATPLCSQAGHASPLFGMAPMYLLMAAFHLVPWFRLTASRSAA